MIFAPVKNFITGNALFQSISAYLTYILLSEPLWFAFETFFAVGLALSVFRDKLIESA